jgi:hypothetical protein
MDHRGAAPQRIEGEGLALQGDPGKGWRNTARRIAGKEGFEGENEGEQQRQFEQQPGEAPFNARKHVHFRYGQ